MLINFRSVQASTSRLIWQWFSACVTLQCDCNVLTVVFQRCGYGDHDKEYKGRKAEAHTEQLWENTEIDILIVTTGVSTCNNFRQSESVLLYYHYYYVIIVINILNNIYYSLQSFYFYIFHFILILDKVLVILSLFVIFISFWFFFFNVYIFFNRWK